MYAATYIGGSANFNALALHYGLIEEPVLFAGANAVDNVVTALWLAALLIIPGLMNRMTGKRVQIESGSSEPDSPVASMGDEAVMPARGMTLLSLSTLLALAFAGHWIAQVLSDELLLLGVAIPSVLILTTLAWLLAQLPLVQRLEGANLLGTYGAYLFLAVIGAYCDLASLMQLGRLGGLLLGFVSLAVLVHGIVVFGGGRLLRLPPEVLAVASSANIGGAATVLPIARSLGRMDQLLPGILAGSLGTAMGTYLGFLVVWLLGG
jgi:uncharacterized membrane protein